MLLKSEAVPLLAEKALTHYGSEADVYVNLIGDQFTAMKAAADGGDRVSSQTEGDDKNKSIVTENGNRIQENKLRKNKIER